jgi:hypothetical protein
LGVGTVITYSVITNVVATIVSYNLSKVYYHVNVYFKSVIPEEGTFQMHVAEKDIYDFYADKNRTVRVGDRVTTISYLRGYVE